MVDQPTTPEKLKDFVFPQHLPDHIIRELNGMHQDTPDETPEEKAAAEAAFDKSYFGYNAQDRQRDAEQRAEILGEDDPDQMPDGDYHVKIGPLPKIGDTEISRDAVTVTPIPGFSTGIDFFSGNTYFTTKPARRIIFLMGPTCVGKSSVIDVALTHREVGAVQVGKTLRAKYPPEHFRGQDNPAHTQDEADAIMVKGLEQEFETNHIVFVDGQPRTRYQVERCLEAAKHFRANPEFVVLHCPTFHRRARAEATRKDGSLDLALQRVENDVNSGYDVLIEILRLGFTPKVYSTVVDTPGEIAKEIL